MPGIRELPYGGYGLEIIYIMKLQGCVCVCERCGPPPWVTKGRRRNLLSTSVLHGKSQSALPHGARQCTPVRPTLEDALAPCRSALEALGRSPLVCGCHALEMRG